MGFFKRLARTVTSFIPGPVDDLLVEGAIALFEGGNGGGGGTVTRPAPSQLPPPIVGGPGTQPGAPGQLPIGFEQLGIVGPAPAPSNGVRTTGGTVPSPLLLKQFADFVAQRIGNTSFTGLITGALFSSWPVAILNLWNEFQSSLVGNTGGMARSSNGRSGNGTSMMLNGCLPGQVVMQPGVETRLKAPKGFVIVDMPDGSGKKAVEKTLARKCGLWKPAPKPPITASEWKTLKKADRVKKKAKKIAQTAEWKVGKK